MKRKSFALIPLLIVLAMLGNALAQKDKKWTDWNKSDVQKMLNDSPWAKVQTDTDTSEQMFSPANNPQMSGRTQSTDNQRLTQGSTNQATNVTYYVRFFSARPIRQALARNIELSQTGMPADAVTRLHSFAEVKSADSIIVTVTYKGNDQRAVNPVMQAFNSAITATLKNNTYLQRPDGKQLFLEEYVPPGKDGFGARFIFLRTMDGKPFIDKDMKEIRFFTQFGNIKVDRRFKIGDMMYEGELEY
ncbi:MAG TPA: hypothetical protein VE863_06505 [Pyrinomonadaceae bacterium]|jgi:hypothetical protein|nr:hypothetical protein [Pyrinomonadaceae bacterium]